MIFKMKINFSIKALLNYGVADRPRTADNQTPLDLALEGGHKRTAQVLSMLT
jgi:hypothetical protein